MTTTTAIADIDGRVVAIGVWTPLDGEDPSIAVAVFEEPDDESPTPVLVLDATMAVALAGELLAAAQALR